MKATCVECGEEGKYTCSKCRCVKYCSVPCSKKHLVSCSALQDMDPSAKADEAAAAAARETAAEVKEDAAPSEGETADPESPKKLPSADLKPKEIPNRTPNLKRPRLVGPLSIKQLERLRYNPEMRVLLSNPDLRETLTKIDGAFDARYHTETALLNDPQFKDFAEKVLEIAKGPELGIREDISDDPLAMFAALVEGAQDDEEE